MSTITTQCGQCSTKFKAKEALAGKKVKCPKCSSPISVPTSNAVPAAVGAAKRSGSNYNPVLDLLDEAGVKAVPQGPVCDNCGTEMHPASVICIDCGFNMATREQLKTEIYDDVQEGAIDPGQSDTEKIMEKAEKAIDDSPVTAVGQNFGDGADSFVIAAIATIGFILLMVIGVTIILSMDWIMDALELEAYQVSLWASVMIALGCTIWISWIAFSMNTNQGLACVCTAGLYCVIFGFMQGSKLLIPTIGLLFSFLIGAISWAVGSFGGKTEFGQIIDIGLACLGS